MTEAELNNIRYLEIEIEKLKKKLSTMPCDKGLGEMNVDGMPHASGNADKIATLAIERAEILTEYENALKTRSNEFKRAFEFISNIPDSETRLIFFDRFLEGMTYEQIGADLYMDAKTVFRRIKNYLSENNGNMP